MSRHPVSLQNPFARMNDTHKWVPINDLQAKDAKIEVLKKKNQELEDIIEKYKVAAEKYRAMIQSCRNSNRKAVIKHQLYEKRDQTLSCCKSETEKIGQLEIFLRCVKEQIPLGKSGVYNEAMKLLAKKELKYDKLHDPKLKLENLRYRLDKMITALSETQYYEDDWDSDTNDEYVAITNSLKRKRVSPPNNPFKRSQQAPRTTYRKG